MILCDLCKNPDDPINPNGRVYRRVTGWERQRDAGGTNALALRQPQDVYAHVKCVDQAKRGIDPSTQGSLL